MKKYILMMMVAGLGSAAFAKEPLKNAPAVQYKLDTAASTFKWHATKVTGEHSGTVKYNTGTASVNQGKLTGGEVQMNMRSIDNTDMTGEYRDKLVAHLNSDDFFSTASHPEATLKINKATLVKDAKAGSDNYNINASLTIKGITKPVTFPARVVVNKNQVIFNAEFEIDRTEYDIRYGSGKFFEGIGDKAIMDKFDIKVRAIFTR